MLLVGFGAGLTLGVGILARVVARNRRRIARLESHQRAQDRVLRHLAQASLDPEEPPPIRREHRSSKGAAGLVGVLALLGRRHLARAAFAASGTAATAAVLAVTLTPAPSVDRPGAGAFQPPSSPAALVTVETAAPTASASVSPVASTPPAAAPTGPAASAPGTSAEPTSGRPLLAVSLPPIKVTAALAAPTVTLLPTPTLTLLPAIPSATVPTDRRTPCVVDLDLPPPLRVCVP